ncbi:MAG: hypothetical protein KAS62_09190 [Candidatus Delongbacteria bacterium]|nr:hypothetical protein [Candidatus Delongbacteria bacterium]
MRIILIILTIWGLILLNFINLNACTVLSAGSDSIAFGATNKDWHNTDTRIKVFTASEGKYGRLYFGYQIPQGFQNVGGMNEHGLWYDGATLPSRFDVTNHLNKPTIQGELCEKALEECATVDEVIEVYSTYFTPHWNGHSMWSDANGNSVIIEYGENDVVFIQKQDFYQIMTNYYISDSTNTRWYNCYRYQAAEYMFENSDEISIELLTEILRATHARQIGIDPTLFSNIYDLTNREIYIYNFHNYNEFVKLDLDEELAKGDNYYNLPELFHQVRLKSPEYGSISDSTSVLFKWYGNADSYYLQYSQDENFSEFEQVFVGSLPVRDDFSGIINSLGLGFILFGSIITTKRKKNTLIILIILGMLFVSCSFDFVTSPYSESNIEHSILIDELQTETEYFWKVIAIGDNGINSESRVWTFYN